VTIANVTQDDFTAWAKSALPTNWFSEEAKASGGNLYATLRAIAKGDETTYTNMLALQSSLTFTNAEGSQVDDLVRDYYGTKLKRQAGETDSSFKARALARLFVPVGTEQGMSDGIERTLGTEPIIITGRNLTNPGGWARWQPGNNLTAELFGHFAWDEGNFAVDLGPYQALITVYQPEPSSGQFLTYSQIMRLIEDLKPEATIMWVKVVGPPSNGGLPIMAI
jgi:hypothetical protein